VAPWREAARVSELDGWDRRTAAQLEDAYVAGGAGPRGSGSTDPSEAGWRAKRQHLTVPMDTDADRSPRPLFDDLATAGHPPDGVIRIDRPHRHPLLTAWLDA